MHLPIAEYKDLFALAICDPLGLMVHGCVKSILWLSKNVGLAQDLFYLTVTWKAHLDGFLLDIVMGCELHACFLLSVHFGFCIKKLANKLSFLSGAKICIFK